MPCHYRLICPINICRDTRWLLLKICIYLYSAATHTHYLFILGKLFVLKKLMKIVYGATNLNCIDRFLSISFSISLYKRRVLLNSSTSPPECNEIKYRPWSIIEKTASYAYCMAFQPQYVTDWYKVRRSSGDLHVYK